MKVFHDRVSTYHSSVPERELDLLRRMKHRNVIGILGREKEVKKKALQSLDFAVYFFFITTLKAAFKVKIQSSKVQ